jgi:uncharacterized protein
MEDELTAWISQHDSLKIKHDTLAKAYTEEITKAREMIDQLKNERRLNYNALAKYKKEIESMRAIMKNYLKQIDSLNKEVKVVSAENIDLKKKMKSETLRAEMAEEAAKEAQNLIKQGSVLRARDIRLVALRTKGNSETEVPNIDRANKLRIDFAIGANELAEAGRRNVYVCLTAGGYLLCTEDMPTFKYQGAQKNYSAAREVDYQNEDIPVSIFYDGKDMPGGKYKIELYMDDTLIGSTEVEMKSKSDKSKKKK